MRNTQKNDHYNNYRIGDFFADEENYDVYGKKLEGYVIVECSFFQKVYDEPMLLFNYPVNYKSNIVF